jgi:hypothetical protein
MLRKIQRGAPEYIEFKQTAYALDRDSRKANAKPVLRSKAQRLSAEEPVVEDVVVRQRGPFRGAGGAACELDVDRIVEA